MEEAALASEHGDVPVGCVLVWGSSVLARAHNRREVDRDPTAHAEVLALRRAAALRGGWRLDGVTAYVTLEPCCMCAGALLSARVERVVFGATDPKSGALASLFAIGRDPRLPHRFEVAGGIRADEATLLLRGFFEARREGRP